MYWIVGGFFGYWVHRLYHSPIFWQVHRFHHAAPELNFDLILKLVAAQRSRPKRRVFGAVAHDSGLRSFRIPRRQSS